MTTHASGTFEVKLTPQPAAPEEPGIGRLLIGKQFSGDLMGHSAGQMLSLMTDVKGSAGYVALERFSGTLHGRTGSFALQHSGSMDRGVATLSVRVVPDSGAGELVGLAGEMTIEAGAGHAYTFAYTLPK